MKCSLAMRRSWAKRPAISVFQFWRRSRRRSRVTSRACPHDLKRLSSNVWQRTKTDLLIDLRNLKRRLDVDAEIERTAAPEKFGVRPSGSEARGVTPSLPRDGTPSTRAS